MKKITSVRAHLRRGRPVVQHVRVIPKGKIINQLIRNFTVMATQERELSQIKGSNKYVKSEIKKTDKLIGELRGD